MMKLLPIFLIAILFLPISRAEDAQTCQLGQNGLLGAPNTEPHEVGTITPCRIPDGYGVTGKQSNLMVWSIFLIMGIFIGWLGYLGILRLSRIGKALIGFIDPDGRSLAIEYHRPSLGEIVVPSKPPRRYMLDGRAKHGGKYSSWLIDRVSGANYVAPVRADTFEGLLDVLQPSNPESYHAAMRRRGWWDVLTAGMDEEKKGWIVPVAIIGGIVLIAIFGMLIYVVSHIKG